MDVQDFATPQTFFKGLHYTLFYFDSNIYTIMHISINLSLFFPTGVDALAHGCPKLKRFVGKGLKSLTDSGLISLAQYCKNLDHINLCSASVSEVLW